MLVSGCVAILCLQCTRPELIGGDLLENESSGVGFTDTISVQCSLVTETSVVTYLEETGRQTSRNLIGKLDDPFFGTSEAQMFSEIFLFSASAAFLGKTIDSVVLTLRYDTFGLYGDLTQQVELEAFLLDEELSQSEEYRSDYAPMAMTSIGSASFVPQPHDSLSIISRGDTARIPPMVRIMLSDDFKMDMLAQDSATFQSADSFRQWINGIHVKMTQGENTMLGFDLRNVWSGITVYYHGIGDTINAESFFKLVDGLNAGVHHSHFVHDYTGSVAQAFLDDQSLADSLLFVQGMSGLNIKVSLPGLRNLDNILINKAELEFYAAELPEDSVSLYPRVRQLINGTRNDEGDVVNSEDVSTILQLFGVLTPFGGNLTTVDSAGGIMRYRMNITASLQDIYKGATDNEFLVTAFPKSSIPNRVILYGPGHPTHPVRLRLTYTNVQ
jgi:hypothetical protein